MVITASYFLIHLFNDGFLFCFAEIHNSLVGTTGEDEFDKVKTEQDQILEDMVPKMNKEATKLVDVYRLTDLIGEEILDSLRDDAIKVLKASPADSP